MHQTWVIVHERARGRGKSANRRLLASVLLAASHAAMAGPTGGQVTAGNATINQNGATTTVTQASQNLSLNWQSFNTANGETVNFVQPSASAIAVNRISDNNATQFYGALNANGQVYLVNPNGVVFGSGSQINVGGLVASTLDVSDASLNSATRQFSGAGTGSILNQGTISTARGGYVALLGNTVRNQGAIHAGSGAVALGAGSDVTLSFAGNSLVQLQVNQGTLNNLADNGGLVKADGGAVWLSAGARDAVLASVVNNTGIIEAKSVAQVGGTIILGAGSAGTASNSGTLDASASQAGGVGGTVKVLGGAVRLAAGSTIDVSGDSGGGSALIGGNFLGTGPEMNAHASTVETGATIRADAITAGHGGNVAVWSDHATRFDGSISARGGAVSGNGGQVETSGQQLGISAGATVSTAAPHGKSGEWLLDPDDIVIGNGSVRPASANINVDVRALTNALNSGNVTIKTTASTASCSGTLCTGNAGNGDIIVLDLIGTGTDYANGNQGFNWTSNTSLTLSAYRNVVFKYTPNLAYPGFTQDAIGGVYADGLANVVIKSDNTARGTGTVIFEAPGQFNIYLYDPASTASIYYNANNYTPVDYTPYMDGSGSLTTYMAVNVAGAVASKVYNGTTAASLTLTPPASLPSGVTLDTSNSAAVFSDKNVGTNKAVTITGVNFTGGGTTISRNGQNYYINGLSSATGTITAKALGVNVSANSKTYDGNTTATLSGATLAAGGVIAGDNVTLNAASGVGTFASANAGASQAVTVAGYTLNGTDRNNYTVTQPTGVTAAIAKANLVLTGTRAYDGTSAVAGGTLTATGVSGQTFAITGAGDVSNLASKNVQGSAALASITGLGVGSSSNGGLASNYNALTTAGSSYSVTAKPLTLTGLTVNSKTYDATTAATLNTGGVGYTGVIAGDSVSLSGSGTASFVNKNAGASKAVNLSGFSLGGADAGNYVLTQPAGLTGTIGKADIVATGIAAASKTYDGTTAVTLTGTPTVTALASDVVTIGGTGSGSFADANAGAGKAVTVTGYTLAGADAGNYNLVQPNSVSATINQAAVTLNGSKTYDGTTAVAGSTLTAVGIGGQTFAVTGTGDISNLVSKNVQSGTALASIAGLGLGASSNGGLASNYVLSTAGSSYAVTPKGIVLTGLTALDKVYDGTTAATLNTGSVGYAGLVGGDSVTLAGSGSGAFASKNAGANKAVIVSGYSLGGSDAGNYVLSQPVGLSATIAKADLVVANLAAANKTYDGTTSATLSGTAMVTPLGSDAVALTGSGSASFASKNAGANQQVTVTGYTLAGADAGNYNLVQPTGLTATVSKANLVVTGVTAASRAYDATTVATLNGTATVAALGGDLVSVGGTGTGAFADPNAGAGKAVAVSGYTLAGLDAGNYNLVQPSGLSATISQATLSLVGSKIYDGTTSVAGSTLTAVGVGGQTFAVTGAGDVSNLVSRNVQGGAALASTTGLTLGASSNGGLASNYVFGTAGSSYAVTPKGLTLSGITAFNKVYDATTAASLDSSNISYAGLVIGDSVTLAGSGTGTFASADAGINKTVTVSGYSLGGSSAGNYVVSQPAGLSATISRASVTVSGSKIYDGTTAMAGSTLTATGVAGQTFAVTGAGDASNLLSKNVQSGTALASTTGLTLGASSNGGLASNYVLSTAGSSVAVTPKGLTLNGITALGKTYDATTAASLDTSNVGYSGLVGGDSVTLSGSGTGTFASADAGSNKTVTVSGYSLGGSDAGNYVVSQPNGLSATISQASVTLSGSKIYDGTTAVAGGTLTATGINGQTFAVTGAGDSSNLASKNVQGGAALASTTGLVLGASSNGGLASNYVLDTAGSRYAVTPKALALTGISALDKTYDATTAATLDSRNVVYAGLVAGDNVTLAGGTGTFSSKDAGANKSVTVSGFGLAGSDAGNYVVAQPGVLSAAITRASLAVGGLSAADKTYDATTGATLTGNATVAALGGDAVSVSGTGVGTFADANAGAGKAVSVTGYTLAGNDAGNYDLVQPAGVTATIRQASVTLSGSKTYDGTTAVAGSTLTATGINGQTFAVTGAGDSANLASKNVQDGAALASTAGLVLGASNNGGLAGNYVLDTAGSRYTVTPKALALTGITALDKTYDATTAATLDSSNVAYAGLVAGDNVTLAGGSGAFSSKDAGASKSVTVSGYRLSGSDAGNYVLAQPASLTATINKASLVVSGITADNKAFDGTTAATVNTGNATLAGRLGTDVVTLAATGQFADATAGTGKPVNLTSSYGGADLGNYTITGQSQAFANIVGAPVVVPDTPAPATALPQPVQNVVTQVQASLLPPQATTQPQVLTLSSTLVVQQTADAGGNGSSSSSDSSAERTQERSAVPVINTTAAFGMPAPLLRIQNGGMQLPLVATSIKE
ncbi:hypothetical protein ASF61_09395 [Duganella sp. Leaf126]|nr:hypothetical protein ASF61_09395 [Duganella sp. Leaf126]